MFVLDDFSDVIAVFAQSTEIYFAIEKQVLIEEKEKFRENSFIHGKIVVFRYSQECIEQN